MASAAIELRKGNLVFSPWSSTERSLIVLTRGWRLQGTGCTVISNLSAERNEQNERTQYFHSFHLLFFLYSFSFWFSLVPHIFPSISLFCFWWQTLISSNSTWFIHLNLSAIKQLCPWGIKMAGLCRSSIIPLLNEKKTAKRFSLIRYFPKHSLISSHHDLEKKMALERIIQNIQIY